MSGAKKLSERHYWKEHEHFKKNFSAAFKRSQPFTCDRVNFVFCFSLGSQTAEDCAAGDTELLLGQETRRCQLLPKRDTVSFIASRFTVNHLARFLLLEWEMANFLWKVSHGKYFKVGRPQVLVTATPFFHCGMKQPQTMCNQESVAVFQWNYLWTLKSELHYISWVQHKVLLFFDFQSIENGETIPNSGDVHAIARCSPRATVGQPLLHHDKYWQRFVEHLWPHVGPCSFMMLPYYHQNYT